MTRVYRDLVLINQQPTGPGEEKCLLLAPFVEGGSDEVSTGPAGRHVRSDLAWRKLRNHNTATTLEASSAPRHLSTSAPTVLL